MNVAPFGVAAILLLAAAGPGAQAPASVAGVVFDDVNANGRRDPGERGLAGVAVSNQHEVVQTAADGSYALPRAGHGVVFVSLPDGYDAAGPFWQAVSPSGGKADFGLTARPGDGAFSFIHASDTHVSAQTVGRLQQLRAVVEARRPDFVIVTGDLVRDALRVGEEEARGYYDIYTEETARFPVRVWSVPGNHENFGIERHLSLVSSTNPLYGKGMYRQRLGPNYYSFTRGGVHFVGLDSVDIADLWYYGHVDDVQLAWLKADLARLPDGMPVVTFNHIPFVSSVDGISGYRDDGAAPTLLKVGGRTVFRHIVSNLKDVLAILGSRDWPLALGGHVHTRESIRFGSAVGTRFHQAAAVVGPTDGVVPAISGVTLYRVTNRVVDEGEFIPLQEGITNTARAVRPGIEVFLENVPPEVRGRRVGLITNHAGIDRAGASGIDLLRAHKDVTLVALFAAEHGIRGTVEAGEKIDDARDARSGLPIFSLYMSEDRGPTPQMLTGVDALVYDLPEVGGRTWTYVSTMALAMQAAARKGIPFVVLDRPNPIGGEIVEGGLLDPAFKSFVGMYPIPARHGMTVGELATFFNEEFDIGVNLVVVRAANWRRSQWFADTGLPWRNPSPNLRSPAALNSYPGTVYVEGTNLTEGRGTDRPFEQIGAPWLDAAAVVRVMNERRLPGVRFEAIRMAVDGRAAKFSGQVVPAIRFSITDREAYRPVRTSLLLIDEIRRRHPTQFEWGKSIDRLTGSDKVRRAIEGGTLPELLAEWDREASAFVETRRPYLLYQ